VLLELACGPKRMQARPPQRLVDVDVSQARRGPLVEERRFERGAPTRKDACQDSAREGALQGLVPESPCCKVLVELSRLEERPRPEAANIPIGDVRSVV
jgi:hypothetical protein